MSSDNSPRSIYLVNGQRRVLTANRASAMMLGAGPRSGAHVVYVGPFPPVAPNN